MADVVCRVCGAKNPPGVQFCESCGVELAPAARSAEPEIDKLLEELVETKQGDSTGESLDIDKEIVDELLDSLLIEEEAGDHFDCPLCGTKLPLDARSCPKCGATFAEVGAEAGELEVPGPPEDEEEARTPAARPALPTVSESAEEPVAVAVTDEGTGTLRVRSGKLIDVVVFGTIGGLFGIFLLFQMWRWSAIAANPVSIPIFVGVAVAGMAAGFVLFRISTGAIGQGDQLVKEGRYEDALYHYDRAIRTGSKPASAWTSKGVALKRLGRLDEALKCHNAALKLDPENEIAWCNKGDIFFRSGNMERAIECYDKAIEIRPKYAIAWNNKGAALARMGRFEAARTCQDEAVKLKPRYVAAWLNRGEVLARLGLRDEAEKCLKRARALGAAA
ncbi:MAG TPA: tetratricopeptide repeat protein [Thermoplasmata archaeon]|nr:tetratricopeptide repeat protein [Thermoplasmata archaeon]